MKRINKVLLSTGLTLLPLSTVWAAGWAPPVNKPTGAPTDLEAVITNTTNWILGIVGMIAVLAIIWGGVQYLTAAGNEDTMRTAKKTITTALMGLVVAGLAYAIVNVLVTKVLVDGAGGGTTAGATTTAGTTGGAAM